MTIKAVWTDFGGVLTPPLSHTMMTFCRRNGLDPAAVAAATAKVTARYGTHDVMLPLDTPLVSEADWLRQVGDEMGIENVPTSMADAWFDNRETNQAWLDRLRDLRAQGVFVGLLSNMVPTWDEHWRRMVDPADFDEAVLSFEVGLRKPDRAIFDLARERCGFAAEECLFVDDLADNCAGAEAAGWQAVHFVETDFAIAELDAAVQTSPTVAVTAG